MATISRLAINLGWNGKEAESGLARTAQKTKQAATSADEAGSAFGRLAKALKGANDVKSGFEMLRGVTQFFIGAPIAAVAEMIKLGGELETMQTRMGLLAGGFDEGAKSLENLRQITRDMGVPLTELVSGFQQLTTAGVDTGSAEKLMRTFANVAPLLGQGGLNQLAGGISQMVKSGVAEASVLQQMQSNGLKVYEALAQRLSNVTGQFHSVEDAMQAVENRTVQASTAMLAMQDAVKTPEAIEAAKKLFESFEGQFSRLQQGVIELFRDIGKGLIDGLNLPAFLASLRGVVEAIGLIVKQIVEGFARIGGDGNNLEANFKTARDMTLDLAEALVNGALDMVKTLKEGMAPIVKLFSPGAGSMAWAMSKRDLGLMSRAEFNALNERATAAAAFGQDNTAGIREATKEFFDSIRNRANKNDVARGGNAEAFNFKNPNLDFMRNVNVPQKQLAATQDMTVQRLQAGSAAAVEAMIRNQMGGQTDKQDQMVAELKEQTRQGAALVAAMAGMKLPAIAVLPN